MCNCEQSEQKNYYYINIYINIYKILEQHITAERKKKMLTVYNEDNT